MFLWTACAVLGAYIVIREGVDFVQARKAAKVDPTVPPVMKGAAGDVVGRLAGEIQAFLKSLGVVEGIDRLQGNAKQILAFSTIVIAGPHILAVVDADKRASVIKALAEIKLAISGESPDVPNG